MNKSTLAATTWSSPPPPLAAASPARNVSRMVLGTSASRPISHHAPRSPSSGPPCIGDIATTSAEAIDLFRAAEQHDKARGYIGALGVNLVLNAGWSWLFFRYHKLGASALGAAALTASSADLARRAADADPRAGAALTPYPLWCAFATVLSTHIWHLNR